MTLDRISYDTGVSSQVESDISLITSRLESLMNERNTQVMNALSEFQMDGADQEYQQVETRWKNASAEVRNIIALVRQTLEENSQTAVSTQNKTRSAIANIG